MEQRLKQYADTLYEDARLKSFKTVRSDVQQFLATFALRGRDLDGRALSVQLSGIDVQRLLRIYDGHIERCMLARVTSYQEAFSTTAAVPTETELTEIWNEAQDVRIREIRHVLKALRDLIASKGGSPYAPEQKDVEQSSGSAFEHVFQQWKIWRAKVQLMPPPVPITEREKLVDKLTAVYNREEFDLDLESLSSNSTAQTPLSLLFMDLDKFKSINDGPGGHDAGDNALKVFAATVSGICSGKGAAYRYGGDEFCVLLPNHSIEEAAAVAERIRSTVQTLKPENLPGGLSTSIGVATLPHTARRADELRTLADTAMYQSKKAGGNRVTRAFNAE